MAGFDDLLDPNFEPVGGDEVHEPGTNLNILVSVFDGDDVDIDLSAGYTASCRPETRDGRQAPQWTHALVAGRQIVLGNGTIAMKATKEASLAAFTPFVGEVLVMALIVVRTIDGAAVTVWRDAYLPIVPRRNP